MQPKQNRELNSILSQLIEKYHPIKVILFGSAALGHQAEVNDLDFLIVKDEVPKHGRNRAREIRKLVKKKIPCDFLVYKMSELRNREKLKDPFILQILKEGKVLYGE